MTLSKMTTTQLREIAAGMGAENSKLYGTSKMALIIIINNLKGSADDDTDNN